jgi:predicted CopG family antitoxin
MNTTIQLKQETLEKLKRLKETRRFSSYDDLINKLIEEASNLPKSMFGIDKGKLNKFNESDRLEFRES